MMGGGVGEESRKELRGWLGIESKHTGLGLTLEAPLRHPPGVRDTVAETQGLCGRHVGGGAGQAGGGVQRPA